MDWRQQLKQALQGDLWEPHLDPAKTLWSDAAAAQFKPVMTETMAQQVKHWRADDPILAQFIPTAAETIPHEAFQADPVGDSDATQAPGVIHKYPGRVLLIASGLCAVNCRYCFRRHFPYAQSHANQNHWQGAIEYLKNNPSIHEVILSGGDPLTLSNRALADLSTQLEALPQIKTLRFHSRIPVVLPTRIDAEFIAWSQQLRLNKVMVLHINHAQELGDSAIKAIQQLQQAGHLLLNQSVLLKGINDDLESLSDLSQQLIANHITPYYLHQMDPVQNAAHFEVPILRARELHQALQQRLPGYMVPRLAQEIPGQSSKTLLY